MKAQSTAHGQVIKNGKMVYTEMTINAAPAKVWQVLTDFNAYPDWNPFIRHFKGHPVAGGQVEVLLEPSGGKSMTFKPTILQYKHNMELRWIGNLALPYIFDGEHVFVVNDNGDGTTTFQQYECFRGILIPFMKKMLDVDTARSFRLMNEALKKKAECL